MDSGYSTSTIEFQKTLKLGSKLQTVFVYSTYTAVHPTTERNMEGKNHSNRCAMLFMMSVEVQYVSQNHALSIADARSLMAVEIDFVVGKGWKQATLTMNLRSYTPKN